MNIAFNTSQISNNLKPGQLKSYKVLISIAVFSLLFFGCLYSQTNTIPVDPNVKIGFLPNGIKYYIRKNLKPEKRVELRLAVNAGSVEENEDQLGMAHLIEHMCFDGTKHFPKKDLIHYLQSVGSEFGADINAFTSFDETVFELSVPTDTEKILNNGIQILEDWSQDVTFDTSELRKERGVVLEEWRLGRGAGQRMRDKFLPVIFGNSKYSKRIPIGTKESIENSTYKNITDFYHDWYRPNLMAFIIVGDIDPVKIEQKLNQDYAYSKIPVNTRKKEFYPVPDNDKTQISVVSDKENPVNQIFITYKTDTETITTLDGYKRSITYDLFTGMMNQRLKDLTKDANPPFINAGTSFGNLVRSKNAYYLSASVGEGGFERGLKTLLTENERVRQFGFTNAEYDRYKKILLKYLEQQYNERDKTESGNIVEEYIDNFLSNEPVPGIEFEYNYIKANLNSISLDQVNQLAKKWIKDNNRVIVIESIDKEGVKIPEEKDIAAVAASINNEKIEPLKEKEFNQPLMSKIPAPGKIEHSRDFEKVKITEIELSNGARIILKPTDFKNDEIKMSAFRQGGQSVFPADYNWSAVFSSRCISDCGLGNYSKPDLDKVLAGKNVSVSPYISTYYEGFTGTSSVTDLETMFQIINMYFTSPRFDEKAYDSYMLKQKQYYKNVTLRPESNFFNQVRKFRYNNNPRTPGLIPDDSDFNSVGFDKICKVFHDRFSDAGGFTFVFVGSFDISKIRPLIEIYLASLPGNSIKYRYNDLGIRPVEGPAQKNIYLGTDPKSYVYLFLDGKLKKWNREDDHLLSSVGSILDRIYTDKLREEMGQVYAFNVGSGMDQTPYPHYHCDIIIPCSPDNADTLVKAALSEINRIKTNGFSSGEIQKEVETQTRAIEKALKENGSWLSMIQEVYKEGENISVLENPYSLIKLITPENLQRVAKQYLDVNKFGRVTLYPENFKIK